MPWKVMSWDGLKKNCHLEVRRIGVLNNSIMINVVANYGINSNYQDDVKYQLPLYLYNSWIANFFVYILGIPQHENLWQ